ncbi:MAG TPA: hypothetical protein VM759_01665 [Longimicrobium sp.]|nr:hypothetical protein [Longimicrobium sp.]
MLRTAFTVTLLGLAPALAAQDAPYFQQGVDYRIEARLDEQTSVLHGRARMVYTNHSPNTLDTLFIHQHLNAFRPGSAWARRELEYGERRFTDLGPADYAYERFTAVTIDGATVRPVYPGAPDSTVAALSLPRPLAPGASVTVMMDWDARLSTLPRRQGRSGRHYDFAQWYPRIAVYDRTGWAYQPLLPQGEFYGEFGRYDVTLDLAADQVIGSTGAERPPESSSMMVRTTKSWMYAGSMLHAKWCTLSAKNRTCFRPLSAFPASRPSASAAGTAGYPGPCSW